MTKFVDTLDKDQIAAWKAQHGEVHAIPAPRDADGNEPFGVVVRLPSEADYLMFREAAFDEEGRKTAGLTLFDDCVVYPDRAAVAAYFRRRPFEQPVFVDKLLELAGSKAKVEAKKL
ncbi:MAG TPA: hypothetical protein VFS43_00700 [Polyangiaceae bacterium]|nr:hypothetical protein [Polyangiaceae bacterium]